MKQLVTLLCLLLLAACAQPPEKPDWLDGEPAEYSSDRYLLGRGQGESSGVARDRARADLAKNFSVKIREQSRDQLFWQQGGEGLQGLQTSISRDIQAQTEQLIEGVKIADSWRSEEGGDYYALAVLDRLQAANRLRARIYELDEETAENIARARRVENLPEQISAARSALAAQLKRQSQQQMLTVVDHTGSGVEAEYQIAELRNDFYALLNRWQITPQVTVDELGGLPELLAGALGNAGVLHRVQTSEAEYLLVGAVVAEDYSADGWYWQRGVLSVALQDRASGRVYGNHNWPFKVSSRQAEMVRLRARSQLAETLDRELLEVLTGFGEGEQLQP